MTPPRVTPGFLTELISPGPGVTFTMDGTPAANAAARVTAWRRSMEFLREHLA